MPILKSFVVDLPYIPSEKKLQELMLENKWTRNEAMKFDYDENWKNKASTFSFESRTVLALYTRFFQKFTTTDCKGIEIGCVESVVDSRILNFTGILSVQVVFDFDLFSKLSDYEKKKNILETLKRGLDVIIQQKSWDRRPFDEAYKKVVEVDYVNEWYWKKALKSPTKEYSAMVFCNHTLKSFDIDIVIRNRKGKEIKQVNILSVLPDELIYKIHLGELKWVSDNTVSLINQFGTKQYSVKVD